MKYRLLLWVSAALIGFFIWGVIARWKATPSATPKSEWPIYVAGGLTGLVFAFIARRINRVKR